MQNTIPTALNLTYYMKFTTLALGLIIPLVLTAYMGKNPPGTADPTTLLETVKKGMVDVKLIDESVLRLLGEKFGTGLFKNPYVGD